MKTLLLVALAGALALVGPGSAFATDSGAVYPPGTEGPPPQDRADGSLTTIFAQNNNFAGNSFDITALTCFTVAGFDCNLATSATPWTVDVYWREGTANGFEQNPIGWNLLGTAVVTGAGIDLPTYVGVGGLSMAAGQTRGIIITAREAVSGVGGFHYTNGGPNTYSNLDMRIMTYRGLADGFPPASVFAYRTWNGTVYYDYCTTPVGETTWGSIKVGFEQ